MWAADKKLTISELQTALHIVLASKEEWSC